MRVQLTIWTIVAMILFQISSFAQSANERFSEFDQKFEYADSLKNAGEHNVSIQIHFGLLTYLQENIEESEDYFLRLSKTNYNISYLYLFLQDSLTVEYADKAIANALKTSNYAQIEKSYSLKYYCLYDVPGSAEELNRIADQCIKYSELAKNDKMLAEAYMHKCNALVELNQVKAGNEYCERAEVLFQKIESDSYLSSVYNNIGNVFIKSGDFKKALDYHLKGYLLSVKINDLSGIIDAARNVADDYMRMKNYQQASEYFQIFADSLVVSYDEILHQEFIEANARYETAEKDKELAEKELAIQKQNLLTTRIVIIGLCLIFIIIGLYQWISFKQKRKKLQIEQALIKEQEFNAIRTTFLENIAHEIRTPVTLINGYLDIALEKTKPGTDSEKNILAAIDQSNKVLNNANEILELLKFEKGKLPIRNTKIRLESFMRRVFYSFQSLAEIKEISLDYYSNCSPDLRIISDENRLEKILNNFISNAIKYSPANSKIQFKAVLEENNLRISIKDAGPGIGEEEQELIFERFYQSSENPNIGGVGVGLSLAKEFAQSLGGSVSVSSIKGEGSTFHLFLPIVTVDGDTLHEEPEAPSTTKITPKTIESNERKLKILIVEDNPEMNEYLSTILSPYYHCEHAFDGGQALQLIQTRRFDLIISDVMMPNTDGFELREKLNRLEHCKNIPFVFITAKALETDRMRGLNLGVDDYITKPFNKNELIARIQNLIFNKKERELWVKDHLEFIGDSDLSAEEKLMDKVKHLIQQNLSNDQFKITELAEEVGYSQRQLARLLKKYTGLSPVQYVLELRLQRAYICLLENKFATLSELRYHVGIPSATHFNRKFLERFGVRPGELQDAKES